MCAYSQDKIDLLLSKWGERIFFDKIEDIHYVISGPVL